MIIIIIIIIIIVIIIIITGTQRLFSVKHCICSEMQILARIFYYLRTAKNV